MHTPDEIRTFLSRCQQGDSIGLDLRGGKHVAGEFLSFDGGTVSLKLDDAGRVGYTVDEIRRVLIEITSEGPE